MIAAFLSPSSIFSSESKPQSDCLNPLGNPQFLVSKHIAL